MGDVPGRLLTEVKRPAHAAEGPRWASLAVIFYPVMAAGLVEVSVEGRIELRSGGSPGARLDKANFSQVREEAVRKGLVTRDEIDRMLLLLDDPSFVYSSPVMFSASGRRPRAST